MSSRSIIKSYEYAQYQKAIENENCLQIIIKHYLGFKNAEGEDTNKMESVLSHFKTELRMRRGVMLKNM